jgi:hypothetical protein
MEPVPPLLSLLTTYNYRFLLCSTMAGKKETTAEELFT